MVEIGVHFVERPNGLFVIERFSQRVEVFGGMEGSSGGDIRDRCDFPFKKDEARIGEAFLDGPSNGGNFQGDREAYDAR